jgi:hypothetical protein
MIALRCAEVTGIIAHCQSGEMFTGWLGPLLGTILIQHLWRSEPFQLKQVRSLPQGPCTHSARMDVNSPVLRAGRLDSFHRARHESSANEHDFDDEILPANEF